MQRRRASGSPNFKKAFSKLKNTRLRNSLAVFFSCVRGIQVVKTVFAKRIDFLKSKIEIPCIVACSFER